MWTSCRVGLLIIPAEDRSGHARLVRFHNCSVAAGQNHCAIVGVGTYRAEKVDELRVRIAVKDERIAVIVERHFQNSTIGARQLSVWKAFFDTQRTPPSRLQLAAHKLSRFVFLFFLSRSTSFSSPGIHVALVSLVGLSSRYL